MFYNQDDTIIAPATVPGTGAISVIRVSGPEAIAMTDAVVSFRNGDASGSKGYTLKFGTVPDIDDVLVSIFRSPNSYTGEDSVEISCHASSYIVSRIVELYIKEGARVASPGEFTQRAYVTGKMDLAQAEAVADLIASQNGSAHRLAMNQMRGGFSDELSGIRASLLELTSLLELELDFSEEDVEFADRSRLLGLVGSSLTHVRKLADSFRLGNAIRNGIPVAIAGAANSGKSTLLNTLLGDDRAIVSDIAGTTRDTVEEVLNLGSAAFRFIDTAGIRETEETIEKLGIERSLKAVSKAEIVLLTVDGNQEFDRITSDLETVLSKVDLERQKVAVLVNKSDIFDDNNFVSNYNKVVSFVDSKCVGGAGCHCFKISAKTGAGVSELVDFLSEIPREIMDSAETSLVVNARHHENLLKVAAALQRVAAALGGGDGQPSSATSGDGLGVGSGEGYAVADSLSAESGYTAMPAVDSGMLGVPPECTSAVADIGSGMFGVPEEGGSVAPSVMDTVAFGTPPDIIAEDLRDAIAHLGAITGSTISPDEVLGEIFGRFCIGK